MGHITSPILHIQNKNKGDFTQLVQAKSGRIHQ